MKGDFLRFVGNAGDIGDILQTGAAALTGIYIQHLHTAPVSAYKYMISIQG